MLEKCANGNAMRKTVHLCLSSHDEVLFRNEADLNMGFNCLALASLETESRLMAEGFMTSHYHAAAQTDDYKELMHRNRYAYARYFASKYCRRGKLGERKYFILEIEGLHHTVAALNYILRQGLHHGLSATPFDYPYGSANSIFRTMLGKTDQPVLLADKSRYKYLPANVRVPENYRMTESGLLLREDILDTRYVEEIYISPRNFLFQMNKAAGEEDFRRQSEENGLPPITMDVIERGVAEYSPAESKVFEQGRVDHGRMTDLQLCKVIDDGILPRYFRDSQEPSIYLLPVSKRAEIGEQLWRESREARWSPERWRSRGFLSGKTVTEKQLRRCLALPSAPR